MKYIPQIWLMLLTITSLYASDEALKKQRDEIIREELINKSNSIDVKNKIAHLALSAHNWSLATDALDHGADPCCIAERIPPHMPLFVKAIKLCQDSQRLQKLAHYSECGSLCIKALYDHGINIDSPDKTHGATPLHQAASLGNIKKIERLIACRAEVLKQDKQGRTPAAYAMLQIKTVLNWSEYHDHQKALVHTLIALQKGTKVNILDPRQYPFYQEYRKMVLGQKSSDDHNYRAYAYLTHYLKEAEKEYFK